MVQLWQEPDPTQDPVDVVAARAVPPEGWRAVFQGIDDDDQPLTLIHEDSPALRRMAVFDVVVNNADRKGGHILPMPDGATATASTTASRFHVEHKLRTVLWGWRGEPLDRRRAWPAWNGCARTWTATSVSACPSSSPTTSSRRWPRRCDRLLAARASSPARAGDMPAFPWPFF